MGGSVAWGIGGWVDLEGRGNRQKEAKKGCSPGGAGPWSSSQRRQKLLSRRVILRETAEVAGPQEIAGQAGPTQGDSCALGPVHPHSWTRPITKRGSCSGHWMSRRSRARICKCSWNMCSPGGPRVLPQGRGLPGAHTQGGGASSPGAGVRAGALNGPRGEDREGRDLDVLGPESCPLQAGRARARKPGKGVQEVRPAGSLGVVSCGQRI